MCLILGIVRRILKFSCDFVRRIHRSLPPGVPECSLHWERLTLFPIHIALWLKVYNLYPFPPPFPLSMCLVTMMMLNVASHVHGGYGQQQQYSRTPLRSSWLWHVSAVIPLHHPPNNTQLYHKTSSKKVCVRVPLRLATTSATTTEEKQSGFSIRIPHSIRGELKVLLRCTSFDVTMCLPWSNRMSIAVCTQQLSTRVRSAIISTYHRCLQTKKNKRKNKSNSPKSNLHQASSCIFPPTIGPLINRDYWFTSLEQATTTTTVCDPSPFPSLW